MADQNALGVSNASATDRLFSAPAAGTATDRLFQQVPPPNPALDTLEVSRDTNPDEEAANRNVAAELGATPEQVRAAPERSQQLLRRNNDVRLLNESPVTSNFLKDINNSQVSHDSVEALSFIEALGNGLTRGWLRARQAYEQFLADEEYEDIIDGQRSYGEILRDVVEQDPSNFTAGPVQHMIALQRYASSRILSNDVSEYIARQRKVGELAQESALLGMSSEANDFVTTVEQGEGLLGKLAAAASDPVGMAAFSAEVGIEFLPQLVVASAATAAARNPTAGALTLGAASAVTERYTSPVDFLRAAGIDLTDPKQLDALLVNPELVQQAQEFGFTRGAIIGAFDAVSGGIAGKALAANPMADLLLQTAAQMALGGGGEAAAQRATTGEVDLNEVVLEAVGELATTPVEIVGVGGRPLLTRVKDAYEASKAEATAQGLEEVGAALEESPVTERAPDVAAQHVADVFGSNDVQEVYIPREAFNTLAVADREQLIDDLGVRDQYDQASTFDGDVTVGIREFSRHVMQVPERLAQLKDHVRSDADGITNAEAQELLAPEVNEDLDRAANETEELVSRDTTQADSVETESAVTIAEHETGVAALFKDAASAGFTETQYASYIEAIKGQRDASRRRAEVRRLNAEKRRLDAAYQEEVERTRPVVEEELSQTPTYNAINGVGVDRLDRAKVEEIFQGDTEQMQRLPTQKGRRLYSPQGVPGIDPDVHADLYGFHSAHAMFDAMINKPSFEDAVEAETTRRVEEQIPTIADARTRINEAKEELARGTEYGTVLAFELARLRQMRGQKRIRRSLVRARAKTILADYRVGRIQPSQFETLQRREGLRATRALRAGDLEAASVHKLNQLMAHEMTREAYKIRDELARGNKAMRRIQQHKGKRRGRQGGIPIEYLERAQEVLSAFQFGTQRPGSRRLQQALDQPAVPAQTGETLKEWGKRKREAEGIVMDLGDTVIESDGRTHWRNLTLIQWRDLRNTVKEIERAGREVNQLRNRNIKAGVQQIVSDIAEGIASNLVRRQPRRAEPVSETTTVSALRTVSDNVADAKRDFGINVSHVVLNVDSLLRQIDGFESLGTAYTYLKGGIDRAHTEGYLPGQVGYVRRLKQESQRLLQLFDMFSKTERNLMWREEDIPGVRQRLSRFQQLGVLLNMGNADGIRAMVDSGQFTEAELQAVVENASKRDMEFVQGVWDFFDSFRGEVQETVRRRQNRNPVMVDPVPVTHSKHGSFKGGYFPLHYDADVAVLERLTSERFDFEEARDMMLRGGYTSNHTQDGHTRTRVGSGGRPVKLDPFVINHSMQQLVYDLEMGDAVHDAYKVLHHPEMKKAFSDQGMPSTWQAIDLWLGDAITGEVHRGGFVERSLRSIRVGTTVSRLAFNVSTAMLQPLGLFQTAAQIGKTNTVLGLYDLVGGRGQNPNQVYKWVTEQSGFMAERERSFNKDVHLAQHNVATGLLAKVTPGRTSDFIADSFFYLIAKMQRFVDVVTWLGAHRQGTKMFPTDSAKARLHADRMVARSQGTGIFHERTNFERGTISPSIRNTEMVRVWSLFLSYFAAKMNVAWERTKRADFKNKPMEYINYPIDMVMLFAVEGVLAALIKEGFNDDPDDDVAEIASMAIEQSFLNFAAGIPLAREFASASQGFATGGALGGFAENVSRAKDQVQQGEIDAAALKSINNVAGVLFRYPSSQLNKTGQALWNDINPHDDAEWWEYLTGPRYEGR